MHERKGLPRKALTVCHRVHREVREEPSCFREDRRAAEEAVLWDIHSGLGDNPARPHEVLRVDDVAADSVADKGRPPKPRPVVCWNSMVSDHRTRSCYHLSTIHSSSDTCPSIFHHRNWYGNVLLRAHAHTYTPRRSMQRRTKSIPPERLPSEFFNISEASK